MPSCLAHSRQQHIRETFLLQCLPLQLNRGKYIQLLKLSSAKEDPKTCDAEQQLNTHTQRGRDAAKKEQYVGTERTFCF